MEDRELLELAAKAARIDGEWYEDENFVGIANDNPYCWLWNPLKNDGDALRLAVKLGMVVFTPDANDHTAVVQVDEDVTDDKAPIHTNSLRSNGDDYAATRRAIVRAAAEIGKSLK